MARWAALSGSTHVELLRRLAESCVVLLDKVPADLILGKVAVVLISSGLVLVLLGEAAVGSHVGVCNVDGGDGRLRVFEGRREDENRHKQSWMRRLES